MGENPKLSIVIPAFNEEGNLHPLIERLKPVLHSLGLTYEIILVDDGSTDQTLAVAAQLHQNDHRIKTINFSRNFGHMMALSAGLDAALGEAVITMDADLQHPPELIPELVARWRGGSEVVNTLRQETKGSSLLKNFSAGAFYWLINKIAKINLPANSADYRLLDRKVVDTLKGIRERSRFLRGLIRWVGFRQEFIPYQAEKRFSGKTKYSFGRMFAFAVDGITSFSAFPLKLSAYFGLIVAAVSFVYILYALYVYFFTQQAVAGWTSVLVAVLFIGGIQLIFLGVIGEYLSRIYDESKARPLYIVSRRIGW